MEDDRRANEQGSRAARASWAIRWLTFGIRFARLSAFCAAVLGVALVVSASRARGDVGEKMITLGRDLLPMADLLQGVQRARVNGESMYLASTVTDDTVRQVLDRYETHCLERTGGVAQDFDAIPAKAKASIAARFPAAWNQRLGVVREQRDDEGMVVCIAQNGEGGIRGLVDRLSRFLADGELSHLGELRYAYVQKTSTGQSHLLTTFTEGPFNVYRVIGRDATQPREELDGAPLPTSALTPMTFRVDGMPYAVQAFQSRQSPEEIAAYYLEALPRFGWEKISGPGDLFSNIVMRRQGVTLLVTAMQFEEGGKSSVTVTEGVATTARNEGR